MKTEKYTRKDLAIKNAISNWTDAKNKSKEYCEEQIKYFNVIK